MLNYNSLMNGLEDVKKCYFIYSYDSGLVLNFIKKVEEEIAIDSFREFNYAKMKFDNNFDVDKFFEVCNTIPMMQDKKLIVLENATFLKSDSENSEIIIKLKEYLKELPSYCVVVVYYIFQEQDKNKDRLKNFSSIGEVCKIQELKGDEFYREVNQMFKEQGIILKSSLLSFFCERVINDFFHIKNEILKLKSFVGEREITKEDIEAIVSRSFEHNIFSFINSVLDKNLKLSLKLLKELINVGKETNYIFAMLTNQFLKFLDVNIMLDSGMSVNEIISKTKINQYVLKNFLRLSKKYSLNELINIMDGFLELEYRVKSSGEHDMIYEIENYLLFICSKK